MIKINKLKKQNNFEKKKTKLNLPLRGLIAFFLFVANMEVRSLAVLRKSI